MICRDATPADVGWLVETTLENYARVFVPMLPECDWTAFDAAHFLRRFDREWPQVRIIANAGEGGLPLGFANVSGAHVDMFFVACRRQAGGIGGLLLGDIERSGANGLECFARNAGARRFYERHGWRHVSDDRRQFAGVACDFVRYAKP